jgi:hypothetical protein
MKWALTVLAAAVAALVLAAVALGATGGTQQVERLGPKYLLGGPTAITQATLRTERTGPKYVLDVKRSTRVAYATLDAVMLVRRTQSRSIPITRTTLDVERLGPKYLVGP